MKQIVLMALAGGRETAATVSKLYQGVVTMQLVAINPTKAELDTLYKSNSDREEPKYTGVDDKGTPYVRIDFYMKTVPQHCNNVEEIKRVPYFLRKEKRMNKDQTKIQVINAYGETAWLTKDEYSKKLPPAYNTNYSTRDVRPTLSGEEELTGFIKKFLAIPTYSFRNVNGDLKINSNPDSCLCQLGKIDKYFAGDISEIKVPMLALKNNMVKLLAGVRTTDQNKNYQDFYTKFPMSLSYGNMAKLEAEVKGSQSNGSYPNTDFGNPPYDFIEWKLTPTELTNTESNPFLSSLETPNAFADTNTTLEEGWGQPDDLPFD